MPRCRPFKLIDVMILIAVAALGMSSMRPGWNRFQMFWAGMKRAPTWQAYAVMARTSLTIALFSMVSEYIWIRLIPPRPPGSDLIRQPGMLALVLMIGLAMPLWPLSAFVPLVAPTNMIFALALGLSWCVACRRYQSLVEPGWIEGLGRFIGVGLIVATAAS